MKIINERTIEPMNSLPDYEPTGAEVVPLESYQIEHAIAVSRLSNPESRWQVYLSALALAGFEQWLKTRTTEITLNSSQCQILEANSDTPTAVCHLQANRLKLCLIAVPSFPDSVVVIPDVVIDSPSLTAQFYIPISVYEETEQVSVQGFLRYDELIQHRSMQSIQHCENGTYSIPSNWFDSDLDRLLLYLSCLDSTAIPLPANSASNLKLRQLSVQPIINVRQWIQQQVDEALDWIMLPPLNLSLAVRNTLTNLSGNLNQPTEEFASILTALVRGGMLLPENSKTAYQDLQLGDRTLRLYATAASLANQEWSLLLILRSQNNQSMQGISMQETDGINVIINQTSNESMNADFLYGTAIGSYGEQFLLTLTLADGTSLTLPPFAFQSEIV